MSKKSKKEIKESDLIQEREVEDARKLKERIKELENLKTAGKFEEMHKLVLSIVIKTFLFRLRKTWILRRDIIRLAPKMRVYQRN